MSAPALAARLPASPGTAWPTAVLLFSAALWGLTWWPIKQFGQAGLTAPMLSVLTYGPLSVAALVVLRRSLPQWRGQAGVMLGLVLAGGWANVAFANALMVGEVARVMFLFYLSPVWSVLGGRLVLGERLRPRRLLAVALALAGLVVLLGGWQALLAPFSHADLLALSAGLAFAVNNVLARKGQSIPMAAKTVAVMLGCFVMSAVALTVRSEPWPPITVTLAAGLLAYAAIWLVLATATWQYGVTHLETGRAGIVLVAELVVGVGSAAWLGPSRLGWSDWIGGAFITAAALIEAADSEPTTPPAAHEPAAAAAARARPTSPPLA